MGVHFSSLYRWEVYSSLKSKMQVLVLLLSASAVFGAGSHGSHGYSSGPHCHDKKDHQCHKIPKQSEHDECHVEYDVVVDVTYIEECEYVVTTHCKEEHQQVHHSSHVVGHDSQVVGVHHSGHSYGGYHKRDADAGSHGYSSGPHCEDKKDKQCHKHPKENSRKIPKQICKKVVDTTYIEECEEIITTHCRRHMRRFTTVPMLLVMDIMVVMVVITSTCILYIRDFENKKITLKKKKKKKNPPKKKKKKKKKK